MMWFKRFLNLFRRHRLNDEIAEELAAHMEEAIERGRAPQEARRAFGAPLLHQEHSRDLQLLPWLDALSSDVVFGWRQLNKHRTVSAAAILSLALAIGATTAAFRLVDAVLLRPLPVARPERLFYLANTYVNRDGRPDYRDDFDYPTFREHLKTLGDRADLMVIGSSYLQDGTFGSPEEMEKIDRQYVSGNVFSVFGLQPSLGRLITPQDDVTPGGHPIAVLSYDYWNRRFGSDPKVIGKSFRLAGARYEIIGVGPKGFTGTEPGATTDVFTPASMNVEALKSPGWSWFRIWVRPKIGFTPEDIRQPLQAVLTLDHQERAKKLPPDTPRQNIDAFLNEKILLFPAAAGASEVQRQYRQPLLILAILVALVLLVACVNVGNLLTAQASARAREMAMRVSIGAGQWRLIQLVLVESALLATIAAVAGALLSWWSAPLVVSMLAPPDNPVRLVLDADWRSLGFGAALTLAVTLLFGLAPALRASGVKPLSALKGGADPHGRRGLMNGLVTAQMAFCVLVLFMAGLFVTTFERLENRPLGFSHDHLLALDIRAGGKHQPAVWMQVAGQLGQMPGVQSIAMAGWAPMTGNHWTLGLRVPGRALQARSPYAVGVSPGYFETMQIGWIDGRDLRPGDTPPGLKKDGTVQPGVGIVNEAVARAYFDGQNPVGRQVQVGDRAIPLEIIGYVRDAAYSSVREGARPTVYLPIEERDGGTFLVRSSGDPGAMAPLLRREIPRLRSDFRVRDVKIQSAVVRSHMIRERLLATLSLFFAAVALVLAGIGLYGVLNYGVIQQRREIGIRMALGARSAHVVRRVITGTLGLVCLGVAMGLAGGLACERFVETLLFDVKATDFSSLAIPILALLFTALVAALHPAIRAVRIDPAQTLRSE